MLRSSFLKSMAFAALASNFFKHIPLPVEPELKVFLASPTKEAAKIHYQHVQYKLGFTFTKEMLEDDVYSQYIDKQLINRWGIEMLLRFNTDLDITPTY